MRFVILLTCILVIGCKEKENPKVKIVDRQRVILNEIAEQQTANDVKEAYSNKPIRVDVGLLTKIDSLKMEYDSLEMELKKY